jgi:hypothetical protein
MGSARGLGYVEDVTIFGNALHLLVDGAPEPARIARDLEAAANAPVHVRPIEPSLEDVFVRLTKLASQAETAPAAGAR